MVYNNQLWDPIESFDYTGTMKEFTLKPGTYLFVADGARGGTVPNGNTFVSYGGSTYGILDLNHNQKFYAVVGGNGEDSNTGGDNPKGGYNGGGDGGLSANRINRNGAAGGGATDVRLSNEPNETHKEGGLPKGYKQVEYIKSKKEKIPSGSPAGACHACIETDYIIKAETKLEIVFEIPYFDAEAYYLNERAKPQSEWQNYYTRIHLFGSWGYGEDEPGLTIKVWEEDIKPAYANWNSYSPGNFSCNFANTDTWDIKTKAPDHWGWRLPEDTKLKFVLEPFEHEASIYNYITGELIVTYSVPDIDEHGDPGDRVDCYWPMWIFTCGFHGSGTTPEPAETGNLKIYSVKVWEDDELIHDYVPYASVDPQNLEERGFYDMIDERFWNRVSRPRAISVTYFDVGPDVVDGDIPAGYAQCEFLTNNSRDINGGNHMVNYQSCIQTDYCVKAKSKIEIIFELPVFDEEGYSQAYWDQYVDGHGTSFMKEYDRTNVLFGVGKSAWNPDEMAQCPMLYAIVSQIRCQPQYYRQYKESGYEFDKELWLRSIPGVFASNQIQEPFAQPLGDKWWRLPEGKKLKFVLEPYSRTADIYDYETGSLLTSATIPESEEDHEIPGYDYYYSGIRTDCTQPMWIFTKGQPKDPDNDVPYRPYEPAISLSSPVPGERTTIYSFKVWEDDKLVHHYIPCAPDDGTHPEDIGMFDVVDKRLWKKFNKYGLQMSNFTPGPLTDVHPSHDVVYPKGAYSRILVAGGGGGTSVAYDTGNYPGPGGTDTGGWLQDFSSFGGGSSSSCLLGPSTLTASNNVGVRATQNSGHAFGYGCNGQNRYYNSNASSSNFNLEGQGGGGGGWYGGYAIKGQRDYETNFSAQGGTGGSSYILTESSYKPDGYMEGYEDVYPTLYFRNGMMRPYQAFDGPKLVIYKATTNAPMTGDKIIVPFTGAAQHIPFIPGKYKIKCYGGDGGTRYDTSVAAHGGYVESIFNLPEKQDLYLHVGSSPFLAANAKSSSELSSIFGSPYYFQANSPSVGWESDIVPAKALAMYGGGSTDVRLIDALGTHTEMSFIPEGYNEYEYVSSDGTQACSMGSYTLSTSYYLEIICELTDTGAQQCILGTYGSGSKKLSYAFGIFPVWDPEDPQTGFMYYDTVVTNGSLMPFNQKIRILTRLNVLEWYDMDDNLLGSITAPRTSSMSTNRYPMFFDCCEGTNNTTQLGAKCNAKVYSIKRFSTSGTIVGWWIPYANPNDNTDQGMYNLYYTTSASYCKRYNTTGSNPFTFGDEVEEKTVYEKSLTNTTLSKNSRIVVAGGAGGMGSPKGYGGAGGGVEGQECQGTATTPPNKGPGTQTAGGGFESNDSNGGTGSYSSGRYYCGYGGYGWYGGYSANKSGYPQPTGGDIQRGGSGGSGYVLTATTYNNRPQSGGDNVPPDAKYYMRDEDVVNVQGGNPVRGMTRIEIDVLEAPGKFSVVAGDGTTFYGYNTSEHVWNIIPESELSDEVFEQYGVQMEDIVSDTNIQRPYKLYINNPNGLNIDRVYSHVVPFQPTLKVSDQIDGDVVSYIVDYDANRDEVDQITATYTTTPANNNIQRLDVDIVFDITDVPTTDAVAYMAEFKVDKKAESNYYPEQKPKVYGTMALCNTRNTSDNPYGYKPYIGDLMPDGITPIRTVDCSTAGINGRDIYIAALLNNSIIRIVKYSTTEDKYYLVRDNIPRNQVAESTNCAGSLLVADDKLYLLNSIMGTSGVDVVILEIPFDPEKQMKKHRSYEIAENVLYDANGLGQAFWIGEGNDRKILVRTMYGHLTFNVKTEAWDFTPVPNVQQNKSINSIAMGEHALVEFPYDEQTISPYLYSVDDYSPIASPGYQIQAGVKYVCYDAGYFYIAQRGHLYIMEDSSTGTPKLTSDIEIPDAILQPKQIICSNQIVYILFEDTNNAYAYNVKYQSWSHFMLPFVNPDIASANLYRPICMKGYFFLGNRSLFVTNSGIETTYKIGRKLSSLTIPLNSNNGKQMIYNPEFITVDTVGAHCHDGYLMKTISKSEGENTIYETDDYKWNDYHKIFNYSFSKG